MKPKHNSNDRNIFVILHEKSASTPAVQKAITDMQELGHHIEVQVAGKPGEATVLAGEALRRDADIIVAGGGDGTMNEVVNGIFAADEFPRLSLGILPLGSANDFARGCNIPADPYQALLLAAGGEATMVDVGKINARFFLNVVSCGFGAEISASTPPSVKKALGGGAYSLFGLLKALKMHSFQFRITSSEGEEAGSAMVLIVCNGRQTGGGYQVAPKAFLDDGLLDVVLVREFPLIDLNNVGQELASLGQTSGRYIFYRQLSSLSIDMAEEISITVDGELLREKSIIVTCLARRLPLILPPHAAPVSAR